MDKAIDFRIYELARKLVINIKPDGMKNDRVHGIVLLEPRERSDNATWGQVQ